jgi:adrenodoxin-NADP+ reductase
LGLDGEDKPHIYSARAFVGWYNGLPEYRNLNPDLTSGEDAIIIGQGNVALDVARILLTDVDTLRKTDITDYALEALSRSRIKNVHVVGRRGPLQAAFTIKEVRELLQMENVNFQRIPQTLFPEDLKILPRPKRRLLELLQKGSPSKPAATKSWSLDFLLSPKTLSWSEEDPNKLEAVRFSQNVLEDPLSTNSKVHATTQETSIPTSTLFRSIGYQAEPIPGIEDIGAVFDERRGTIKHDGSGRASISQEGQRDSSGRAKLYCAGWVKRGPTGVIASTMADAFETAMAIVEDWKINHGSASGLRMGWTGVKEDAIAQGIALQPVHWENWNAINEVERRDGQQKGKPREKLGTVEEMLRASKV